MVINSTAYINGQVLQGDALLEGLAVIVENDVITRVIKTADLGNDDHDIFDLGGQILLPGFIDVQVNGGGGVLFNDSADVEGIRAISQAHQQFGTTGLLPTLISDDIEVIQKGIAAINSAIEQGVPGVLGIHIEGPFLNLDKRGIHGASKIRSLTAEVLDELEPVKGGCSLITIAPDNVTPEQVAQLTQKGFIVAAGHSNASYEQTCAAINNGLTGFTHLYNAMSQLTARAPGVVGAALDDDQTWCGIIADGAHVSATALRIAWRCKGPQKLMLVTDAMPPVGAIKNDFELMGNRIWVENGVCVDANGTLAGAALDMASALRNMMVVTQCSLADASAMASSSPAAFLGLTKQTGEIAPHKQADLVVLDENLKVTATIIAGKTVWLSGK